MGGRGAAFKRTSGQVGYEDFFRGWNDETYTKLPTNNTDYLKRKENTWVMSTTDNIQRNTMNEQTKFLANLAKEYSGSTELLTNENNLRIRALELKSTSTQAAFVYPSSGYEKMQICYNKKAIDKPITEIEKKTQSQIDIGFWSPCDKENLVNHTIAHEYGHFIERTLVEKRIKEKTGRSSRFLDSSEYNKYSKEIYKEIYNIKRERLDDKSKERVSRYAYDCTQENFAEIFANLATSKKPTNWGKAMEIYLKENGIKC